MPSEYQRTVDELLELLDPDKRIADLTSVVEVYRWNDDHTEPVFVERIAKTWGGRWDQTLDRYDGQSDAPTVFKIHEGQRGLIEHEGPERHVIALGTPGVGKTDAVALKAILCALAHPGKLGAVIAPHLDQAEIIFDRIRSLAPHFILRATWYDKKITFIDGCVIEFRQAKETSKRHGLTIQGRTWTFVILDESQNIEDSTIREVEARGRSMGKRFRIYQTCTNQPIAEFQCRLDLYRSQPMRYRIVLMRGEMNCFVPFENWEEQRKAWAGNPDLYRMMFELGDPVNENRYYPHWDTSLIAVCPFDLDSGKTDKGWADITAEVTWSMFRRRADFIIGQDFGQTSASVVLKCLRDTRTGVVVWWVVDELIKSYVPAEAFAKMLVSRGYDPSRCIVVADPHVNEPDDDKSNYAQFRHAGFEIHPASVNGKIHRAQRFNMMNQLMKTRRLRVAGDGEGFPRCPQIVQAFKSLEMPPPGARDRKGPGDKSHLPDACGYALHKWERITAPGIKLAMPEGAKLIELKQPD